MNLTQCTLPELKDIATRLHMLFPPNITIDKLQAKIEKHVADSGKTIEKLLESANPDTLTASTNDVPCSTDTNPLPTPSEGKIDALTASTTTPTEKEVINMPSDTQPVVETEPIAMSVDQLRNLTFAKVEMDQNKVDEIYRTKDAMRLVRVRISTNNKNKSSYQGEIFSVRNAVLPEKKIMVPFNVTTHVPVIMLNMIREKMYQVHRKEKQPNGTLITKSSLMPEYNIQIMDPITKDELDAIRKKQLAEGQGNS